MLDNGLPFFRGLGKINPLPSSTALASSSTRNASALNGILCSAFVFIRDGGITQSRLSISTSDHIAPRTSPLRVAVKMRSRRHSLTDNDDSLASMVSNAAPTSSYGKRSMVFFDTRHGRENPVNLVGHIHVNKTRPETPLQNRPHPLFRFSRRLRFALPNRFERLE